MQHAHAAPTRVIPIDSDLPAPGHQPLWPAVEWWKHFVVIVGLLILVSAVFSNSFKSGMTLDNKYIIEEYYKALLRADPSHELKSWKQIGLIFQNDYWWPKGISGLYRPITTFTYWLDYVVITGKPDSMTWTQYANTPYRRLETTSYHAINLVLHWLNAVLVYYVALMLLKRLVPAMFVAALFAAHPITTESVTNIIGRADIFAATTVFGGLLLYVRASRNRDSWALPWLVGLMLLTAFGLFSKESSAAVVLVLIGYDIVYRWRRGNPETTGLLPLVGHGALYLAFIAVMVGAPLAISYLSAKTGYTSGMSPATRIVIAAILLTVGFWQYVVLARTSTNIRLASLAGVALAASGAALFWAYYPLALAAVVAGIELVRGSLTSGNTRFRVVAHAALYLPLYFAVIAMPIVALIFFHQKGWNQWRSPWERLPLGAVALAGGLALNFLTAGRRWSIRLPALIGVVALAIAGSYFTYWMGILLAIIVALHEVILGSFTPADSDPQYRRDWKLVWHGFAIAYLAMIPPLIAMAGARDYVFRNSSPAETPFLDNPIRGIWQVQELNIPEFETELARKPLLGMSYIECKMTAVKIMGRLLFLLAWPAVLSSDYSYAEIPNFSFTFKQGWHDIQAVAALLVLVGIVALTVWLYRRKHRAACFLILLFFLAALPTSNLTITIGSVMAERFMYLPLAGFVGILVIGVFELARWLWNQPAQARSEQLLAPTLAASAFLSVVVIVYGVRAFYRNYVWETDETLWRNAIQHSPRSFRCYQSLAFAIYERFSEEMSKGRNPAELQPLVEEMISTAEGALPIVEPLPNHLNSSRLYLHLGMYYSIKGETLSTRNPDGSIAVTPEARVWFEKAAKILERGVEIDRSFNQVNKAKQKLRGDKPEEITDAGLGPVYGTLGTAYTRIGLYDDAFRRLQYQRQLDPGDIDAYTKIASVRIAQNRLDDAAITLIQCILLDPNRREFWATLAQIYGLAGDRGAGAIVVEAGQPKLNVSHAMVREHLMEAYREFIRIFRRAHRFAMAEDARRAAVERYGFAPRLFDPLFEEPVHVVTPEGVQYDQPQYFKPTTSASK